MFCSNEMLALKCQLFNLFTEVTCQILNTWSNSGEIEISFKFCVQFTLLLFSITVTVFVEILTPVYFVSLQTQLLFLATMVMIYKNVYV